jgi:hypothetical protein
MVLGRARAVPRRTPQLLGIPWGGDAPIRPDRRGGGRSRPRRAGPGGRGRGRADREDSDRTDVDGLAGGEPLGPDGAPPGDYLFLAFDPGEPFVEVASFSPADQVVNFYLASRPRS